MKNILISIILLITFITNHIVYAGEVIIISPDGKAFYENEQNINSGYNNINFSNIQNNTNQNSNPSNRINVVTKNYTKDIYIDNNGNINNVVKNKININQAPNMSPDITNYSNMVAGTAKTLYNINSILNRYGYGLKDISQSSVLEYAKINLLDGDYVIANKNCPYIAEYHNNLQLMGIIKVEKLSDKNKQKYVFNEYRKTFDSNEVMKLKHVLFVETDFNNNVSQYLFDSDGNLLCSQNNNDIFLAKNVRNMLPNWSRNQNLYDTYFKQNKISVYNSQIKQPANDDKHKKEQDFSNTKNKSSDASDTLINIALAPIGIPLGAMQLCFAGVALLTIGIPFLAIWAFAESQCR